MKLLLPIKTETPRRITTRPRPPRKRIAGVTLMELLVVVAIMIVLMSLLVPAFNSAGKGRALGTAGSMVANLANLARQNSMSKNVMTALIVITDPAIPERNQILGLMELTPPANGSQPVSTDWKRIGNWEKIPAGVIVDETQLETFPAEKPLPVFPAVRHGNKTVAAYKYAIFLPGGNLVRSSSAQIRVAEGFFAGASTTPTYTQKGPDGDPANYYQITIVAATGRTKIDRP